MPLAAPPRSPPRTQLLGAAVGVGATAAATAVLLPLREELTSATPALILVVPGVLAAVIGGRLAATVVAAGSSVVFGFWFLPPSGAWKILDAEDVTASVVFLLVALVVGELAAREANRRHLAEVRAAELEILSGDLATSRADQAEMASELEKLAVMEQVDHQRSALLRSVSHDLRTPLATIRAVATDLRSDTPYDPGTRAELLGLVADEAERLDRLVANLLSMSRIEAGAFAPDLRAVDLVELVQACAARIASALTDRRLELDLPGDLPLVDADYTQLDLVITNLLENAARHSPARSTIRVSARTDGDVVRVMVDDAGTGVLPTERQRVFEAFHRSQGSRSSGIGLAICKAVVEAHGGSIHVTTALGGGARFVFTVPVHHQTQSPDRTPRGRR